MAPRYGVAAVDGAAATRERNLRRLLIPGEHTGTMQTAQVLAPERALTAPRRPPAQALLVPVKQMLPHRIQRRLRHLHPLPTLRAYQLLSAPEWVYRLASSL
jgi:hypothetical protein